MILEDIEAKLLEIDQHVYYGLASKHADVVKKKPETLWNYIVFNRPKIHINASKNAYTDYFDVHIVRENYVPDGTDAEVITRLTALPGVRVSGEDIAFNYAQKPNTNTTIEIMTIGFLRARK